MEKGLLRKKNINDRNTDHIPHVKVIRAFVGDFYIRIIGKAYDGRKIDKHVNEYFPIVFFRSRDRNPLQMTGKRSILKKQYAFIQNCGNQVV